MRNQRNARSGYEAVLRTKRMLDPAAFTPEEFADIDDKLGRLKSQLEELGKPSL